MKILVVKMSAIGDVIMTLPAIDSLKNKYPNAQIDWLVEAPAKNLLIGHHGINKVIVAPLKEFSSLYKSFKLVQAIKVYRKFIKELKAENYDIVIDLQGLLKSALMVFLTKAERKIGFKSSKEYTAWALTELMPAFDIERHAARRYLDAAAYLGAPYPLAEPRKYYKPSDLARSKAAKIVDKCPKYIILNPGAKWPSKQWPLKNWQALASLLKDKISIIISGGKEDRAWGEEIKKAAHGQAINLCGETELPVLAALMEKASLVITCDTGPMHLAAAVGAKGLAIFGPTHPHRTGPFGGDFEIITAPTDCLGCLKRNCPKNTSCLEQISPDEIYQKALDKIST